MKRTLESEFRFTECSLNNMEEAPAKVDDRGFPTKGVIAGNDHHKPSSTPRPTDLLHHRNDRPIATVAGRIITAQPWRINSRRCAEKEGHSYSGSYRGKKAQSCES